MNPLFYAIGTGPNYKTDFHDLSGGSNGLPCVAGYDLCAGWGTPNGANLINALAP